MNEPSHNRHCCQLVHYAIVWIVSMVFWFFILKWTTFKNVETDVLKPKIQFIADPQFETLNNLPPCDLLKDQVSHKNDPREILNDFYNCVNPVLQRMKNRPDSMNLDFVAEVSKCDQLEVYESLKIQEFGNRFAILPKCKDNSNNVVTLGINGDTMAEELLNRTLPNANFYGADPIISPNLQLYFEFGKFYPFAIGKKGGMSRFKVMSRKTRARNYQDVTIVDLVYFLDEVLGLKRIDIAWIDTKGSELEFIDMIHRNGPLDQKNIAICQFNIEIHSNLGQQVFHDFIFRILEDKRYVFLKPISTDVGVHRIFFINMEDEICVRKYLQ